MIQRTSASRKKPTIPKPSQIQRRRREIQTNWSATERRSRAACFREDQADRRFEAHLRFVEFLLSRAEQGE